MATNSKTGITTWAYEVAKLQWGTIDYLTNFLDGKLSASILPIVGLAGDNGFREAVRELETRWIVRERNSSYLPDRS